MWQWSGGMAAAADLGAVGRPGRHTTPRSQPYPRTSPTTLPRSADVAITLPQVRGRRDLDQSVPGAGPKIATFAGWWLFAQP